MAEKLLKMAGSYGPPLPPEIWREILATLPVMSILRCRSVCKSWYSLISCPDFISHHSVTNLHNKNDNRVLLQLRSVKSGARSFISHDMVMESREHNDEYDYFSSRALEIVGSCNGLICLSKYEPDYSKLFSTATFLIWNPAIRKIVELPSLNYRYLAHELSHIGFGFDSNNSDYKVLCILRCYGSSGENIQKDICWIFDLRKGVWRSISPLVPPVIVECPKADCYVNGALHWISRNGCDRILLSFNMCGESFLEIRMPDCAEFTPSGDDDRLVITQCVTFDGLVHLIVWTIKKERDNYVVDVSESCSVWAMKEYGVTESWIKVANIDLPSAQFGFANYSAFPRRFHLMGEA